MEYPKLLDLMSKRKWHVKREEEEKAVNEQSLELSLGLPGGGGGGDDDNPTKIHHSMFGSATTWSSSAAYLEMQAGCCATKKESSTQPSCTKVVDFQQVAEKKTFSATNTAVATTAQKRTAPTPVVGWPPIGSFRKNLASTSSLKSSSELPNVGSDKVAETGEKTSENKQKGLFVKINMDGIPIGRKVDLKAYDSYDKLSSAVDQLFRGLLAAQSDSCENGVQKKNEGKAIISGLLDGSGEYTLVYEDNEGDRMLVGDVPWHMFVSTVKRLRVLKTSELPMLRRGAKQGKLMTET